MCTVASRSLGDQIGPPLLFSLRTDYDFDEVRLIWTSDAWCWPLVHCSLGVRWQAHAKGVHRHCQGNLQWSFGNIIKLLECWQTATASQPFSTLWDIVSARQVLPCSSEIVTVQWDTVPERAPHTEGDCPNPWLCSDSSNENQVLGEIQNKQLVLPWKPHAPAIWFALAVITENCPTWSKWRVWWAAASSLQALLQLSEVNSSLWSLSLVKFEFSLSSLDSNYKNDASTSSAFFEHFQSQTTRTSDWEKQFIHSEFDHFAVCPCLVQKNAHIANYFFQSLCNGKTSFSNQSHLLTALHDSTPSFPLGWGINRNHCLGSWWGFEISEDNGMWKWNTHFPFTDGATEPCCQ